MKKYTYNVNTFYNEDAISYYLLGAFMTDGCVFKHTKSSKSYRANIVSKDEDWLISIREAICPQLHIAKKKKNIFELRIYNQEIVKWLIAKGCVPRKSLILQMPKVPHQYLPDFIRGCMDGDGCISISNYKKKDRKKTYQKIISYISSSSLKFILSLNNLIGIKNSFVTIKPGTGKKIKYKNPHYRLIFNDSRARKFLSWIYYPDHKLSLKRKNDLVQSLSSSIFIE